MNKPTVFFSHSSKDKEYIQELKKMINEKTSGTVEIFQSSDGESIPFGKNWVHKIEESLSVAKIMFVFISPNSIKSNWIYFESGFSYSKGIRVIPIGILGVDISQIPPPINLLQGFNLHDNEGINNIIAILNAEFSCKYKTDFTIQDYEFLQKKSELYDRIDNGFLKHIDYIETIFTSNLKDNPLVEDIKDIVTKYLSENKVKYCLSNPSKINLYGMELGIEPNNYSKKNDLVARIDLNSLSKSMPIIIGLLPIVYEKEISKFWLTFYFFQGIELVTTSYKLSSRLNELGIEMSDINGNLYSYKSLLFSLDGKVNNGFQKVERDRLRIVFNIEMFSENEIYDLVNLLFSNRIIYKEEV